MVGLLVLLSLAMCASGLQGTADSRLNEGEGPTDTIKGEAGVDPADAESAQAASADPDFVPFPPTTPDVPAFSISIVEVPPDPQPEYSGVAQVSGVLSSNPQILLVEIRVHAECGSGRDAAMRASEAAAARIRSLLVGKGISETRMRMMPMGCTAPLRSPEVTAADRAANRRIEVVVLEVGVPAQK